MAVTEESKVIARNHLGYMNVTEASTFVLGLPEGIPTQFLIEGAFARIRPEAEDRYYRILIILDGIENQIVCDQELLATQKLDELSINPDEFKKLIEQYGWWRATLGNLLGVPPNPYDMRFNGAYNTGGGGCNAPVTHG